MFRNYVAHKFNVHSPINLKEFKEYMSILKQTGASEIELAGRRLNALQRQRKNDLVNIIHDVGMRAVLYTGPFGTDTYKEFAQRDKHNNPLSLMCPRSGYVQKVFLPELESVIDNFDEVFFDMPWIDKRGCYCSHCEDENETSVRDALQNIVEEIPIKTSVNACAPKIHNEYPSANMYVLGGLFDNYVTEWNPLRWNQHPSILRRSIGYVQRITGKNGYHATTCTDKKGKIYELNDLAKLFRVILSTGAKPRLGIGFNQAGLKKVEQALWVANNIEF